MTAAPCHMIVWIDREMAKIYAVTRDELIPLATVHAPSTGRGHIHHKAGTPGPGHNDLPREYLDAVLAQICHAQEILIVGPSDAKTLFKAYLHARAPLTELRVRGVEPMHRAGDAELHAFANLFFRQRI